MTAAPSALLAVGEWTVRRAGLSDLDALARLERQIFATDAWPRELFRQELSSPHTWYLAVVRTDAPGAVLGYAGLLALPGSGDADVQTIGLAPELRGHGLGRALMNLMQEEARRRAVREMFLDVRVDNPVAQSLYRSLGYEPIGLRKGYYQPDNVDAIVMRLRLTRGGEQAGRDAADAEQAAPAGDGEG